MLFLAACATSAVCAHEPAALPADQFMDRIEQICGKAFAGRVLVDEPPSKSDAFGGKLLVMHVRECSDGELIIPFHVGDDHSRTWIITRTVTGLRLKHDHRHEDGSEDAVTMYGGDSVSAGTAERQEFPVDTYSIEMFQREGLSASLNNIWAMEIQPDQRFIYELARPNGRLFRVEFDLTKAVALPPTAWGHPDP
jgi:hypothetical protein